MRVLPAVLLLFSASWAVAADKPKPTTVNVPDGGKFEVTAPEGWKVRVIQPDPKLPPTVALATANQDTDLKITFIPDKTGAFGSEEKLDAALKRVAEQYAGGSVENKTKVEKIESKNGTCLFAQFTDADLVGKETKPGQYKVVGTGLMLFDKTVAAIMLLGDSFDSKSYEAVKELIKSGIKPVK